MKKITVQRVRAHKKILRHSRVTRISENKIPKGTTLTDVVRRKICKGAAGEAQQGKREEK